MTGEQIKQNAIKAATKFKDWHHPQMSFYNGYIAGAHSRDEEIKELKHIINEQDGVICSLDCEDRMSIIKQRDKFIEENKQLRNPWVSVEDRLPEKGADNISIPVAAITNKGYWFKGQYDYDNKDWFFSEDPDHLDFETDEFVTNWMLMPELKKGK